MILIVINLSKNIAFNSCSAPILIGGAPSDIYRLSQVYNSLSISRDYKIKIKVFVKKEKSLLCNEQINMSMSA